MMDFVDRLYYFVNLFDHTSLYFFGYETIQNLVN